MAAVDSNSSTPFNCPELKDESELKGRSVDEFEGDHHTLLVRAITRILSTDVAEISYGQIIDGVPLSDVAWDMSRSLFPLTHPVHNHKALCPGILEKTREFCGNFQPGSFQISSPLFLAYQKAPCGSPVFRTRLIEIVAVAVHQIAGILFNLDTSLHKNDGITEWTDKNSGKRRLPTLFRHKWYKDYERYPNGVADMVGYWAEARILGGMVQFDRRENGDEEAIYFHSDRDIYLHTCRIYELLPEQRASLWNFLTTETPLSECPLPIHGNENNRHRFDPQESSETNGIYRDIWERLELHPDAGDSRLHCVIRRRDYPDGRSKDWYESRKRAFDRKHRIRRSWRTQGRVPTMRRARL